jgi:hypothetical protein
MNDDDIYDTYMDDGEYDTHISMDGLFGELERHYMNELSEKEREFVHALVKQEQFTVKQIKQVADIVVRLMFSPDTKLKRVL